MEVGQKSIAEQLAHPISCHADAAWTKGVGELSPFHPSILLSPTDYNAPGGAYVRGMRLRILSIHLAPRTPHCWQDTCRTFHERTMEPSVSIRFWAAYSSCGVALVSHPMFPERIFGWFRTAAMVLL